MNMVDRQLQSQLSVRDRKVLTTIVIVSLLIVLAALVTIGVSNEGKVSDPRTWECDKLLHEKRVLEIMCGGGSHCDMRTAEKLVDIQDAIILRCQEPGSST